MALLAMLLAFGPPMDAAAHVAAQAVAAGDNSPVMTFVAAFDVLDDVLDHLPGDNPNKPAQIVITMAIPAPVLASLVVIHQAPIEHQLAMTEAVRTLALSPLDRPPRA